MDTVSTPVQSQHVPDDERRPQVPHTSFSQLDSYRDCSLKYYFSYIDKQPRQPSIHLAKGTAGHAAIEKNHTRKAVDQVGITKDDLLSTFSDKYDAETYDIERNELETPKDIGKIKDDVIDSLTVYFYDTNPKIHPIKAELGFNLDIPATEDYEYPIRIVNGRIDLVDRAGIFDAKFAGKMKSQGEVDDTWQLTLYDMVFEQMTGLQTPGVGYMVFTPPGTAAKDPKSADCRILLRSPEEMEPAQRQRRRDRLVHTLRMTQKAIDAGIFMPTDNPMICGRCDYRKTCKSSLAKEDWKVIQLRSKGAK
jgi:RecB family exonuclease